MNDNKSAEDFKVSFIVVKQDSHLTTSSLLLQPSTLYLTNLPFLCLTASAFAAVQGDTV